MKSIPGRYADEPRRRRAADRIDRFRSTAYIAAMALREILILPDKRLRQVSEPVKKIDAGIRKLIEDMFETMYDAPGIGLAAIQVGTPKRVVTMDLAKKEDPKNPQVFINPEMLWTSEEKATYEEGCLSIPEYYGDVERPAQVKVKYLDLEGQSQRDRSQWSPRHLPAARNRPPQRGLVHRPSLQAQARPRAQEVQQGGKARSRVSSRGGSFFERVGGRPLDRYFRTRNCSV